MPRSTRNILLAATALYLAFLAYRYVKEGAFTYMTADWRRVAFVGVITVLSTLAVVIGRTQLPFMGRAVHHPLLLLGFGIVAGGVIGVLEIAVASALWHLYGEPDGHFRSGWSGVVFSAILEAGFGAAVGIGFGGVLFFIEARFQRALRFGRLALSCLLITFAVFGLAYFAVFQLGWLHPFLVGHAIVFIGCSAAAFLVSTPSRQPPSLPPHLGVSTDGGVPR